MGRRRTSRKGTARATALVAAALASTGCATINRQFDSWALESKARMVVSQRLDWQPGTALPFHSSQDLEALTRPRPGLQVSVQPLPRHRLSDEALVQEELSFRSAVSLRFPESNLARAYVYRHGPLGERPALLWIPGQNVSSLDFLSLKLFFAKALDRGLDVVFFVPPYHLDRTPAGFRSGDAFLATDFVDHLMAFAQELSDLRSLVAWLKGQGVRQLGCFGSSMGGTMALRLVSWEPVFDFVTLMQPVVDWNAVIRRPEMAPVRSRLREQGISDEEVMLVYQAIDSRGGKPQISPSRISVMYGRHDIIAPEGPILALKRLWGIRRMRVYERGHAFIGISAQPYRDLGDSLDLDLAALRWQRLIEEYLAVRQLRQGRPALLGEQAP